MGLSVCFILGELGPSGGATAVVRHARGLAAEHEMDVSIAVWSTARAAEPPEGVRLVSVDEARREEHDIAIATWWRTAYDLFAIPARRRAYFVQQLEERVYRPGDVERFGATATHDLPVAFLSEAAWIIDLLGELRPEAAALHVPNGVDKALFSPEGRSEEEGPLRVLVEGSPGLWFKGVRDAVAAIRGATVPLMTTLVTPEAPDQPTREAFDRVVGPLPHPEMASVYRDADVLLKLSRVEGVFTPPLEAFHCGATCVVWPVTGHDEYVEHAVNGVVVDFDDIPGTAAWIDLLARDRALLDRLRAGAAETAAAWPSWREATTRLADALGEIADGPPPAADDGVLRLLADLDAAMEEQRVAQRRLMRSAQAVERRLADRLGAADRRAADAEARLAAIESSRTWRVRNRVRRLLGWR